MPLLSAEPCVFPDDLFTAAESLASTDSAWLVMHTRPRQEKSLARDVHGKRIPFFLPVSRQRTRRCGRTMTTHAPLFPGYLFLLADPDQRLAALSTKRVARCLSVGDQQRLWADLRQIHRLIESKMPLTGEKHLQPGQMVEIISGPLTGFRGQIIRSAAGDRFIVKVDFIQRGASVLCEGMSLQAVPVSA